MQHLSKKNKQDIKGESKTENLIQGEQLKRTHKEKLIAHEREFEILSRL